ncbi:MAG: TonB-dependent receptor, partial [Gemmatimonadota bacterium]|nr:TonB-dependent receptor [Gemmatimonadota bacterium]
MQKRKRTVALAVAVLIITPALVAAQQPQAPVTAKDSARRDSIARAARPAKLGAVTITSTPAVRSEPSSSVHVSAATIELAPASTTWELLRQTAGMEVHQAGQGPGFASDASVRGFSSDHSTDLALWIDGVPVNEPVNGHAEGYNDWSLIFPQIVQDIDVIKGPTSALFGNFALSGVVNVRTLERTSDTEAELSGGSHGRADGSLITGFDHGSDGGGVFALRALHEDGFRPNGNNDLMQIHARVVRDITPNATVDAGAELYGARWRSPGYLSEQEFADHAYDIVSNPTDGGYKRRAQERVSLRVSDGDNLLWRTTAYATQGRWQLFLTIPPQGGQFEGTGSQTEEEDARFGFGLTSAVTYSGAHNHLTLGTEGRFDRARYENYFTTDRNRDSTGATVTGTQLSGALFTQAAIDVTPVLRLDAGARYDLGRTRSTPDGAGGSSISATHAIVSPKLGALLHVTPGIALYANASRGFRSSDGLITDPSLAPVTLWAYETGLKYDVSRLSASAALFRMNLSNEQTFNPLTSGSFNGGFSRRQGVELGLHSTALPHTSVTIDWTFNDARYTHQMVAPEKSGEQPVDVSGRRVYNTARYIGSAALALSRERDVATAPLV